MKKIENEFEIVRKDNTEKTTLLKFLLPSLHGIVICLVCLATVSWAWFTSTIRSSNSTIEAGYYDVEVSVLDESGSPVNASSLSRSVSPAVYTLENGKIYTVTVKSVGSAQEGFCIVSVGDSNLYHTTQLGLGGSVEFKIVFPGEGTREVQFIPNWGQYESQKGYYPGLDDSNEISGGNISVNASGDIVQVEVFLQETAPAVSPDDVPDQSSDASAGDGQSDETSG